MIEKEKPNLYFKTYSPIIAILIVFIVGYGFFSFVSDSIDFITTNYIKQLQKYTLKQNKSKNINLFLIILLRYVIIEVRKKRRFK